MFAQDELTDDAFLGGKLRLWQPKSGYRVATDAVLLAASVDAKAGQSVLDMGCGVGAAGLCLGLRVPGLQLAGLEVQPGYAELARRNAERAGIALELATASITEMPVSFQRNFDHVITNPPYFHPSGTPARDEGRDVAMRQALSLAEWIDAATRRLAPKGCLTMILRADRLDDAIRGMDGRLGALIVLPLTPRPGRDAQRVILRARKGGRAAMRLLSPFILHDGAAHPGDRENHSAEAQAVLREAGSLCRLFK